MRRLSLPVVIAALAVAWMPDAASAGQQENEIVRSQPVPNNPPPPDDVQNYRPPWANPNAKPPEPGIENDPTPFNPADVEANTDTLNNNIDPLNTD